MKSSFKTILGFIIIASLFNPVRSHADSSDVRGLKGLKGVVIVLQKFDKNNPFVSGNIITADKIQIDVELKLRQSGIPIRQEKEIVKNNDIATLVTDVTQPLAIHPSRLLG